MERQQKILEQINQPAEQYNDLSPKGSIDEGIRDLIDYINTLPGFVSTSSCAGRVSVFLEGAKSQGNIATNVGTNGQSQEVLQATSAATTPNRFPK